VKIFCQEEWTKEETELQTKIRKWSAAIWEKSYSQFLHPLFVFKIWIKFRCFLPRSGRKLKKSADPP
jgi:deoxyribodipyrimidine photo-lyase